MEDLGEILGATEGRNLVHDPIHLPGDETTVTIDVCPFQQEKDRLLVELAICTTFYFDISDNVIGVYSCMFIRTTIEN